MAKLKMGCGMGCRKYLLLAFLAFFLGVVVYSAWLTMIEAVVSVFNPERHGGSVEELTPLEKEIYERKETYLSAARKVNRELEDTVARPYCLGWGVLASLDFMADDNEYWGEELAEMLAPEVTFEQKGRTVTVYHRFFPGKDNESSRPVNMTVADPVGTSDEQQHQDYDLADFTVKSTVQDSETVISEVDTYKGRYIFHYKKVREEVVTLLEEDLVLEVTVTEKYVLDDMEYIENWSRLAKAVRLRYGNVDVDPPVGDVIFAEEWGKGFERGEISWNVLDKTITLADYEGVTGVALVSETGYVWPVEGYTDISSPFGIFRNIPSIGVRGIHKGIDIPAPIGTPVLAVIDGKVERVFETVGGGKQLVLRGVDNNIYLYAHLNSWQAFSGAVVKAGDVIAYVGMTGSRVTGPHLHFEAHVEGAPIDPLMYCGWK